MPEKEKLSVHLSEGALITLHDLLNGSLYEEGRPLVDAIISEWRENGKYPHLRSQDIYNIAKKVAIKHFSTK